MAFPNYRKRRITHGPSKNELRSARSQKAELEKTRAGTLRKRFPQIDRLEMDLRMEAPSGTILEHVQRVIDPDEPFQLDVPCPNACGNGHFDLMEAMENALASNKETAEGLSLCEAASYADPRVPCGAKLFYQMTVRYKTENG